MSVYNMRIENLEMKQQLFMKYLIISNKLTVVSDKVQKDITLKQWMLLAIVNTVKGKRNLSEVGEILGCSRQNVKKIALALEKKGYIKITEGENKSLILLPIYKKEDENLSISDNKRGEAFENIFSYFNSKDLKEFGLLMEKLDKGIEKAKINFEGGK